MAVEWRLIDRSSVFAVCEFFCRGPSWRACTASHSLVSRSGSIRVSRVSALCFLFSSLPLKLKLINRRQRRNSARDRGNRAPSLWRAVWLQISREMPPRSEQLSPVSEQTLTRDVAFIFFFFFLFYYFFTILFETIYSNNYPQHNVLGC